VAICSIGDFGDGRLFIESGSLEENGLEVYWKREERQEREYFEA